MHASASHVALAASVLFSGSALAAPNLLARAQSADPHLGTNNASTGATEQVTPGAGPNGAEWWFNQGIDNDSGWNPPYLPWSSLVHISTEEFYAGAGSACQQYDKYFQASGAKYNIAPAIIASIAMQESSCQANAGGPTPGLMQVDCSNYPNGQCTGGVAANVDAGTHYLRTQLDSNNQNALLAIGSYNGWFTASTGGSMNNGKGLTQNYPCSASGKSNGDPQNLDYLQQTLNGWFLGLNPYGDDSWIGTEKCQGQCNGNNNC